MGINMARRENDLLMGDLFIPKEHVGRNPGINMVQRLWLLSFITNLRI